MQAAKSPRLPKAASAPPEPKRRAAKRSREDDVQVNTADLLESIKQLLSSELEKNFKRLVTELQSSSRHSQNSKIDKDEVSQDCPFDVLEQVAGDTLPEKTNQLRLPVDNDVRAPSTRDEKGRRKREKRSEQKMEAPLGASAFDSNGAAAPVLSTRANEKASLLDNEDSSPVPAPKTFGSSNFVGNNQGELSRSYKSAAKKVIEDDEDNAVFGGFGRSSTKRELDRRLSSVHLGKAAGNFHNTPLAQMVTGVRFSLGSAVFATANAAMIGVTTQVMALDQTDQIPSWSLVLDILLFIAFAVEIALKAYVHGYSFLFIKRHGMAGTLAGNMFDLFALVTMFLELVLLVILSNAMWIGFSITRIIRVLRTVVVLRRNTKHGPHVMQTLMASVMTSISVFVYVAMIIFVIIYLFAVFFTQVVLNYRIGHATVFTEDDPMDKYWGTMTFSVMTLFQAISGGLDWSEFVKPIYDIHGSLSFLFAGYIGFAVFALLNVITGIFVDSAMKNAKDDLDNEMLKKVRNFMSLASGVDAESSTITYEQYKTHLNDDWMQEYFEFIEVDPSEAKKPFQIVGY